MSPRKTAKPIVLVIENPEEDPTVITSGGASVVETSYYPISNYVMDEELEGMDPQHYAKLAALFPAGSQPHKDLLEMQQEFIDHCQNRGITPDTSNDYPLDQPSDGSAGVLVVENPDDEPYVSWADTNVTIIETSSYPLTGFCSDEELRGMEPDHYSRLAQDLTPSSKPARALLGLQRRFERYLVERDITLETVAAPAV